MLATAEARKQACAEDAQCFRQKIAEKKKSWEYALFVRAEVLLLAVIEEIMLMLATLRIHADETPVQILAPG